MSRVVLVGRIDEFVGRESSTAFLTLVTVCTFCSATRTSAYDVSVGQEFTCYFIAVLFFYVFFEFSLVVERAEEVRGKLVVYVGRGTDI